MHSWDPSSRNAHVMQGAPLLEANLTTAFQWVYRSIQTVLEWFPYVVGTRR